MSKVRDFFEMSSEPFVSDVSHAQMFQYPQLMELFDILQATVDGGSMALITGRAGTGKTTAVRAFLEKLKPKYKVIYLGQFQRGTALFCRLGMEFGIRNNLIGAKRMVNLSQRVLEENQRGRKLVLVLDEAHCLDKATFEDLRLLPNPHGAERYPPFIMLVLGQHWLRHTIKREYHEALSQRLRHRFALEGLTAEETAQYVEHHLRIAGCNTMPFTAGALAYMFVVSDGILREINNLAYEALLRAAIAGRRSIDEFDVKAVADQRELA